MDKLVLLIDKDRELLTILKLALEREGFTVITARDGQGGIRMAYQNHPQAIILDVMIDKMDGWRTFQRLRQICDTHFFIIKDSSRYMDIFIVV
jgi:DNA-binding response OmpR family regulator